MLRRAIVLLCLSLVSLAAFPATASAEKLPVREFVPSQSRSPMIDVSEPLVLRQSGDTLWLQVYTEGEQCVCDAAHGGECTGGPDAYETFCFEHYNPTTGTRWAYYGSDAGPYFSQAGGNGFTTMDVRTQRSATGEDFWHLDLYQAYNPGGYSWWCGAYSGDRCENWEDAPGHGNDWKQFLTLNPDLYSAYEGMDVPPAETIYLDCQVRYDLECDYDYAYIKYSNDGGTNWTVLAQFNGTSGNPASPACGDDYFGNDNTNQGVPGSVLWQNFPTNEADAAMTVGAGGQPDFLVGLQFVSDHARSDKDGLNTDGALFVDEIQVYWYAPGDIYETLEFEDMDGFFDDWKWNVIDPPGVCNHWWMAYDPDPPYEPAEGPDVCEENASWAWTACPYMVQAWRIPPECNGFHYRLMSPVIYAGWADVPPFNISNEYAGLVVQSDIFACFRDQTCDYFDTKVNVYHPNPVSGNPGWCGWENVDGYLQRGGGDRWMIDHNEDVSRFMGAPIDSVWYAWDVIDLGHTDDFCWTTLVPRPHRKTQLIIDNVSFGLYDASETQFYARAIDLFQDTFDTLTAAHNGLCANGDLPKAVLATQESLTVDIHDLNGLDLGYVRLYFSVDEGSWWDYSDMVLSFPAPGMPELGGTYTGSIHPTEIASSPYPRATWFSGTEIWYYVEVRDNDGDYAYFPATAAPGTPEPVRPYENNYLEFSILPGVAETYEEPNRILLVDDFGRSDFDFHPAMQETTLRQTEDFYESVLHGLGYGPFYDKYDVQDPSFGVDNEPWGILSPDPALPDSITRLYDTVIWFTSRFDKYTVLDTMQCRLRDFVLRGGDLFICGNEIGADMTNLGAYDNDAADTCSFYESLLGATIGNPAQSSPGIAQPHSYAIGTGVGGLTNQDTFHFHQGCPISVKHDLIRINTIPSQSWSNPVPYLVYYTGYNPGDTLVAIYNDIAGLGTGNVVYMAFDMTAIVDAWAAGNYLGRRELMGSVLMNLFGSAGELSSETRFEVLEIDLFQDTFDLTTNAHNGRCGNDELPKSTLDYDDYLTVDVLDSNGLWSEHSWVRLYFSGDEGQTWNFNEMWLYEQDPENPACGGTYKGTITPSEVGQGGSWVPGTEVLYYIEVRDEHGSLAYWPATAAPATPPPTRPYFNNYAEFSILPGTGGGYEEPNRLLLVDDFGGSDYDFHPAMQETTLWETEDFYESILQDLGIPYDKYDVQDPSMGLRNEPWDVIEHWGPDPQYWPRKYDAIIWFTSRAYDNTVCDSMQCHLRDFVGRGGGLFICGNHIGVEMTDYGTYGPGAASVCGFYDDICGARMEPPGESAPGSVNPHYWAVGNGIGNLTSADTFHFHLGSPVDERHDLMKEAPEQFPQRLPNPYLIYHTGWSTNDTLVAVQNGVFIPEYLAQGNVVHMCFDLSAVVDSCAAGNYKGRRELVYDVLTNLFGLTIAMPEEETAFSVRAVDLFQDSFDLETNAHNAFCANGELPKTMLASEESLTVDILDGNGLVTDSSHVGLCFSIDAGGAWSYNEMLLYQFNPDFPSCGGIYRGSISPAEAGQGSQWIAGTEVWYYIEVRDDDGNMSYYPSTAAPGTPSPSRPYFGNYLEFGILPGSAAKFRDTPDRILLVDDFGGTDYDFHPALQETTLWQTEDFYESILHDLSFTYDKYDVQGPSCGLTNEPWGVVRYVEPPAPDSVQRDYDAIVWFTSRDYDYTVCDTMQCRLRDFVLDGGHLFICGNHIGADMTNFGAYDQDASDTCDFYQWILGAEIGTPPESPPGIMNAHLWATGAATPPGASAITDQDTFHFFLGPPVDERHDLLRVNDTPPPWLQPEPYLIYHTGYAEGDTLVAVYNEVLGGAKVVHLSFDLAALVDSSSAGALDGRYELVEDVLTRLFGLQGSWRTETEFATRAIDLFQDTFDLETDAHNALCANGEMPKVQLASEESLTIDVLDMSGLSTDSARVRLYFSTNEGSNWDYNSLVLDEPDAQYPTCGGTYRGSITSEQAGQGTEWDPGTEVWYYIEVRDDDLNLAYWPSSSAPGSPPPARPYYDNYLEFSILPGLGEAYPESPNRLLVVDDFDGADYDFHPALEETTLWDTEEFYESLLYDLGYCYDKYDVLGPSYGLTNEPWGLVEYPIPGNPDSVVRHYDAVIWFTSQEYDFTVCDTMQCRLRDFILDGGHLFLCGNHIGADMTNFGAYDAGASDTCDFYGWVIGGEIGSPAESPPGSVNPHLWAVGASPAPGGSQITPQDTFHFHLGPPVDERHDLLHIYDVPPYWLQAEPYLTYHTGYAEGDTLVAIYKESEAGGRSVHMSFDLAAMVDSSATGHYKGRVDLIEDMLGNIFGLSKLCPHAVTVRDRDAQIVRYAYSLGQNHPNPFNPDTHVPFSIRNPGRVNLKVYNVRGQLVRRLVESHLQAGEYAAHWDGADDNGRAVASGIYFCRMEAGKFRATRKMILLK